MKNKKPSGKKVFSSCCNKPIEFDHSLTEYVCTGCDDVLLPDGKNPKEVFRSMSETRRIKIMKEGNMLYKAKCENCGKKGDWKFTVLSTGCPIVFCSVKCRKEWQNNLKKKEKTKECKHEWRKIHGSKRIYCTLCDKDYTEPVESRDEVIQDPNKIVWKEFEKEKEKAQQELKAKGISFFRTSTVYNLKEIEEGLQVVHHKTNTYTFLSIRNREDGSKYLEIETYNP
jgi:hypothetical protein